MHIHLLCLDGFMFNGADSQGDDTFYKNFFASTDGLATMVANHCEDKPELSNLYLSYMFFSDFLKNRSISADWYPILELIIKPLIIDMNFKEGLPHLDLVFQESAGRLLSVADAAVNEHNPMPNEEGNSGSDEGKVGYTAISIIENFRTYKLESYKKKCPVLNKSFYAVSRLQALNTDLFSCLRIQKEFAAHCHLPRGKLYTHGADSVDVSLTHGAMQEKMLTELRLATTKLESLICRVTKQANDLVRKLGDCKFGKSIVNQDAFNCVVEKVREYFNYNILEVRSQVKEFNKSLEYVYNDLFFMGLGLVRMNFTDLLSPCYIHVDLYKLKNKLTKFKDLSEKFCADLKSLMTSVITEDADYCSHMHAQEGPLLDGGTSSAGKASQTNRHSRVGWLASSPLLSTFRRKSRGSKEEPESSPPRPRKLEF